MPGRLRQDDNKLKPSLANLVNWGVYPKVNKEHIKDWACSTFIVQREGPGLIPSTEKST